MWLMPGIDHLRAAGGGPIAPAIAVRAQKRAALDHATRDAELRLCRVVALLGRDRLADRRGTQHEAPAATVLGVPVGGPFPDVARHLVQPEAVGRIRAHGDRRAVARVVAPGEVAMPEVRQAVAGSLRLVAPDERRAVEAAASRALPLGLGRQRLAGPGGVGLGVLAGDVHDRVVADRLPWAPARAGRPRPPLLHVAEVDRTAGHREDERSRDEILRRCAGEVQQGRAAARRPSRIRSQPRTPRTASSSRRRRRSRSHRPRPAAPVPLPDSGRPSPCETSPPGIHCMPAGAVTAGQWPSVRTASNLATAWSI